MSALSAAASDKDGDTIKALRAAIEQARNWIAEHPDRRPISAGRMVAILTNALAAAPEPPEVEQPQDTAYREAVSLAKCLFRKHFAHEEDYASGRVVWEPCDTTVGVISQIDNMVCGLVRQQPQVEQEPVNWRELCRKLYIELFHCDQQMTSTMDDEGDPMWVQGATVREALENAKTALESTRPQPPRQPLTEDEINTIWRNSTHMTIVEVVRAIEAAHGIGGEK